MTGRMQKFVVAEFIKESGVAIFMEENDVVLSINKTA
jgi:hypothetical protein